MIAKTLLPCALFLLASAPMAKADFDSEEAFEAHRDFMVGGTWISTDEEGEVEADRHVASKSNKFVRIVNVLGGTGFLGVYGIDPKSGQLTLWTFDDDDAGSVGGWICTAYENGKWTWVSEHKDGPMSGTAVLTRVSNDEMNLKIDGENVIERTWKRKE